MIFTRSRFREVGEALLGPGDWYSGLGKLLGQHRSTIARYAAGQRSMPADMKKKMATLCRTRSEALAKLASELDG